MKYFWIAAALALCEGLAALSFHVLKRRLGPAETGSSRGGAVAKGMLERLTLLVGLLSDFPHILTAFGALKISTRLNDKDDHISNTYFLTGNLLSILYAMLYAVLVQRLLK